MAPIPEATVPPAQDPARPVPIVPPEVLLQRLANPRAGLARYVIAGEIDRGGMGIVLRVHDPELHRELALKRMRPVSAAVTEEASPDATRRVARFLEEAQVTAQLDHPGVVPVHEVGLDPEGQPYFTMKLVRGQTLKEVLREAHEKRGEWDLTRVLHVLLRVCEAMTYAHAHGIVHRDLKPSNVMVGRFGEVYVMDWGLARVLPTEENEGTTAVYSPRRGPGDSYSSTLQTEDGEVLGTPAYMAPEQAAAHPDEVSASADIYSVGAILYHALTGEPPYLHAGTPRDNRAILARLLEEPPTPAESIARDAPPEVLAICRRAMERDVERRYPTMLALSEDLRAYLEVRVVRAYRTGPLVELKKWVARNRGAAALGAALVLTITLAGAGYGWIQSQRAHEVGLRADADEIERLLAAAHASWPIGSKSTVAMRVWIERAEALCGLHAGARTAHDEERARILGAGAGTVAIHPGDPDLLEDAEAAAGLARQFRDYLEGARAVPPGERAEPQSSALEILPAEISFWESRAEDLSRRAAPRELVEPRDPADRSRIDVLQRLARGVEELRDRAVPAVRSRLAACEFAARTVEDQGWRRAIEALGAGRGSPGAGAPIAIDPQEGLVPLGPDPASGLWEFWHVPTGERPQRDADGRWIVGAETGVVLVLISGGMALAGAQSSDPAAPRHDPDARPTEKLRRARLDPYFVSKYELTLGQWRRITGELAGTYLPGLSLLQDPRVTAAHPVGEVDWIQARDALWRVGLELPTELQWEHAARGGSELRYLTSAEAARARAIWNGLDDRLARILDVAMPGYDDGHTYLARVGSFPANGFGLHDVLGNVAEWCRDAYADSCETTPPRDGDGLVRPELRVGRSYRGGSHRSDGFGLRVSRRLSLAEERAERDLGIRPVRRIVRASESPSTSEVMR